MLNTKGITSDIYEKGAPFKNNIDTYKSRPQLLIVFFVVFFTSVLSLFVYGEISKLGNLDNKTYRGIFILYTISAMFILPVIISQMPGFYTITLTDQFLIVKKGLISKKILLIDILSVNCIDRNRRYSGIRVDYLSKSVMYIFVPNWFLTRMDLISERIKSSALKSGNKLDHTPKLNTPDRVIGDIPPGKYQTTADYFAVIPFIIILIFIFSYIYIKNHH